MTQLYKILNNPDIAAIRNYWRVYLEVVLVSLVYFFRFGWSSYHLQQAVNIAACQLVALSTYSFERLKILFAAFMADFDEFPRQAKLVIVRKISGGSIKPLVGNQLINVVYVVLVCLLKDLEARRNNPPIVPIWNQLSRFCD